MAKPNVQTFVLFCFNLQFGVAVRDWIKAHGFKARVVDARSWLGETEHDTVTVLVHGGATPDELAKLKEIHDSYKGAMVTQYREWEKTPPMPKPDNFKGVWKAPVDQSAARAVAMKICDVPEPETEGPKSDTNTASADQSKG